MKFTVSTKPTKNGAAQQTVLEVVDENTSRDILLALAVQSVVIKRQSYWRKHGIPATDSINLKDYAPGTRQQAAPLTKEQMIEMAKNDPAFKDAILAALK